jgi:S1-C subfamily serine protease
MTTRPSFQDVFDHARASIVSIRSGAATGTGFCATESGVVVTNAHVVMYAQEVLVSAPGRAEQRAPVFAVDVRRDLALIALASPPPPLPLADGDSVRVGDPVLAVGDPLGYPASATLGIVSATRRRDPRAGVLHLQTDAAVNPGNSGGPLLDARGQVVGVNTWVRRDADGMAFAVRVDDVRDVVAPFAARLPVPLPTPRYACALCLLDHAPRDRWCARCGHLLGFVSHASGSHVRATALGAGIIDALGFDAAERSVGDGMWRLDTNGIELWVDVHPSGSSLVFSVDLGRLPLAAPLSVLRFMTAANDRSTGPARLALRGDTITAELVEPIDFVSLEALSTALGQLLALASELRDLLATQFQVEPPPHRFV